MDETSVYLDADVILGGTRPAVHFDRQLVFILDLVARAGSGDNVGAPFDFAAARISALNAFSSIFSPSRRSIARRVFPSRLELNRPAGSSSDAPLAKVSFTTCLYVSPVQRIPPCDQTG